MCVNILPLKSLYVDIRLHLQVLHSAQFVCTFSKSFLYFLPGFMSGYNFILHGKKWLKKKLYKDTKAANVHERQPFQFSELAHCNQHFGELGGYQQPSEAINKMHVGEEFSLLLVRKFINTDKKQQHKYLLSVDVFVLIFAL